MALIEEHRRVGIPSHCSGLISPRTLVMGEMGDGIVVNRLRGANIHVMGGRDACLTASETRAVAIDRIRWDEVLAEQAQEEGADSVRTRFIAVERERSGRLRLRCRRDGRDLALTTRLLVGADGGHSRVARSVGLAIPAESVCALGAEGRLRIPQADHVHVFVGRDLAPSWFGWIIPLGEDRVRIGIGCDYSQRPIACFRRLQAAYPDIFEGLEIDRMYGGVIPVVTVARSYDDGVMLVGDAAGQVKPFSGGGIYTGLVAARHCAEKAIQALQAGDLSATSLSGYQVAWRRTIGSELLRSMVIRRFGLSLSDGEIDRLVAAIDSHALREIAANVGDIDYPSRVIMRLARAAPLMLPLGWMALRRPRAALSLLRAQLV